MIADDYETISHWGMIDVSAQRLGTLTIFCDEHGAPQGYTQEFPEDVMPMLVVTYRGIGILAIMGDRKTGLIKNRHWTPHHPGALPPHDAFSSSMKIAPHDMLPPSATRH
jgi:hypothetical protein